MSESVRFTAIYEDAGDGWVMARIAELPEVITQGASEEEAREMVQTALRDWLEFYVESEAGGTVEAKRLRPFAAELRYEHPIDATPDLDRGEALRLSQLALRWARDRAGGS
jgi:predicted RNase H-like HicB family nuclease